MVGSDPVDRGLRKKIRILIVEDEPPIAEDIEEGCRAILGERIAAIRSFFDLEAARDYLTAQRVDLCLLDLNLSGENGFELLKGIVGQSFHTIVVSAYTDRALQAFEYGVLDFIPKPFDIHRLKMALERFDSVTTGARTRYLVVRKRNENHLLPVEKVRYFKADGYLVEAHLMDRQMEVLDKSLSRLEQILPEAFLRIHRSYIVRLDEVASYRHSGGGVYTLLLKNGESLPLSRLYRKPFEERMGK